MKVEIDISDERLRTYACELACVLTNGDIEDEYSDEVDILMQDEELKGFISKILVAEIEDNFLYDFAGCIIDHRPSIPKTLRQKLKLVVDNENYFN